VVAGRLRYLQIVCVEERSGAAATLILRDRVLIASILGWLGTFLVLLYA
jgi:hypothetical protein